MQAVAKSRQWAGGEFIMKAVELGLGLRRYCSPSNFVSQSEVVQRTGHPSERSGHSGVAGVTTYPITT